jgi:uncharacterized protein
MGIPTARHANTGYGPSFSVLDIGLEDRVAVVEGDTAFWAIVEKDALPDALSGRLVEEFLRQREDFRREMNHLRFALKPSAAYFNPTERCNFNCSYCYLPEEMRREGKTMTPHELCGALERLLTYFESHMPKGAKPQLIFHGSEPMLAREAVFQGIDRYRDRFHFGVQTNATLLDEEAIEFLTSRGVGIGISLDAAEAGLADTTRKNWNGTGAFSQVVRVMERLSGYPAFNVITTVTRLNVEHLEAMVDFYHRAGVGVVMFNPVRCTQKGGWELKPDNDVFARSFCRALDRTYELFRETGRKLVVANFANVLAAVAGPTGRRLMCDISPCGGGRCFVAVSAHGDLFPCSEFIGFPEYRGGNLYEDDLNAVLESPPFREITTRKVEDIAPCASCAIRHFCGAPCPAEVRVVSGTVNAPSPYCEFYEEQVRYALRVLAQGREAAYLWDSWDQETEESFRCA